MSYWSCISFLAGEKSSFVRRWTLSGQFTTARSLVLSLWQRSGTYDGDLNQGSNICCATRTREAFNALHETLFAPLNILRRTMTRVSVPTARFIYTTQKTFVVLIRRPLVCLVLQNGNFWTIINAYFFIPFYVFAQLSCSFPVVQLRCGVPWRALFLPPHCGTCVNLCHLRKIGMFFPRPLASKSVGCFSSSHSCSLHCFRAPSQDKLRSGFTCRALHPLDHGMRPHFLSESSHGRGCTQ